MAQQVLIPCGTALADKYHMLILSSTIQYIKFYKYEGWNCNSGNYLFTTDTK